MKKEDIRFPDWPRMFVGDIPPAFYIEVLVRITVIYLVLMVSMRLMGKRMASQMSRSEMIGMVSLAAAIGVAMQTPERGVLAIVIIAAVVIFLQQGTAWLAAKNQRFESVSQGNITTLIADSQLILKNMRNTGITRESAFAQLRTNGIRHLGEVKRLYFEANGEFSLVLDNEKKPGLCILPDIDTEFIEKCCQKVDLLLCSRCGQPVGSRPLSDPCCYCGSLHKENAVQ